jgi:hypothetical protein
VKSFKTILDYSILKEQILRELTQEIELNKEKLKELLKDSNFRSIQLYYNYYKIGRGGKHSPHNADVALISHSSRVKDCFQITFFISEYDMDIVGHITVNSDLEPQYDDCFTRLPEKSSELWGHQVTDYWNYTLSRFIDNLKKSKAKIKYSDY